ncbi:major facilitator superfamily domain-containing protein [Dipodascopsis tothii]|uniref:major facilitator superfamily domain-containing protein n=1 Tax=Dipodascopsis tothii TaxID=44089 RepID=UPI0034CDF26D
MADEQDTNVAIAMLDDEEAVRLLNENEVVDEVEEVDAKSLPIIFCSLYIGVFLAALDGTVVATLLAHISSEFHEFRSVSWIATAYLIAVSACQPLYGKLSDIYGRKSGLIFSNVCFAIGCTLCGLANNVWVLVFARIIAGIGGAGLTSLSAITLNDMVPLRQRSMLQGIGSIIYNAGASLGGVFGGYITDTLGWRWAFLIQVPFVIVSSITIFFNLNLKVPHGATADKLARIDFLGSFTLISSLVLFLVALSIGGNYVPWGSFTVIFSFFFGLVSLGAFTYIELYVAREPIIPIRLLKNRTVFGASFANWLIMMINFSQLFYLPIYFIAVRDISPTQAGTSIIPNFLGSAAGALASGTIMKSTGRYYWFTVTNAVIMAISCMLINQFSLTTGPWIQMAVITFAGFGFGGVLNCSLIAMISAVPPELQAVTTAIQYGFRGTGSTVGVAIASSIFQNVLKSTLSDKIVGPDAEDIIGRVLDSVEEIQHVPKEFVMPIKESYLAAFHGVFYFCIFLGLLVVAACAVMREHVLSKTLNRTIAAAAE